MTTLPAACTWYQVGRGKTSDSSVVLVTVVTWCRFGSIRFDPPDTAPRAVAKEWTIDPTRLDPTHDGIVAFLNRVVM